MGWHERHALGSSQGSRGTSRPETLNLEAWNIMLRDTKLNIVTLLILYIWYMVYCTSTIDCGV